MKPIHKRAVVFGVFDRLHPGHLAFLSQARAMAGEVVVLLARDTSVFRLKDKRPRQSEKMRAAALRRTGIVAKVLLGDKKEGEYRVLKRLAPDLIVLGYDQKALARDLRFRARQKTLGGFKLASTKPYAPEKWHSSIL